MEFDTYDYNDFSDAFFNRPERVYKQPVPQPVLQPQPLPQPLPQPKQDNEKIFLYFIIIILISSIIIMTRDYNSQIFELTRKVVKVI